MVRRPPAALALLGLMWPGAGLARQQQADAVAESQMADTGAAVLPKGQDDQAPDAMVEDVSAEQIDPAEAATQAPEANGLRVGGFAFAEATRLDARSTDVNPDDLFGLSGNRFEAAILVEASTSGFTLRARGEAIGTEKRWPDRTRIRLQELSYQRRIGQRWSVSIGKQERSWDSGFAFRPLGFFRTQPNLSDPIDTEGRQEGLPLVSVTYVGDAFIAEAVISDDVLGDIDDGVEARQWAGRVSRQFGKIDASLVLRQASGQGVGVGGSASYSAGAIELHADAYAGPRGRRRVHRAFSGLERDMPDGVVAGGLFTSDPIVLDLGGRGTVVNAVAGVTWTPSSKWSLRAEYIHRGNGLSDRQWGSYLDLVADHRAALDTPSRGLAIANLAYDIGVLSGSARKDYLYVAGLATLEKLTLSASTNAGLADGSATLFGSATYQIGRRTVARLDAVVFVGDRRSEFGLLPFGTIVSLSLRRSF